MSAIRRRWTAARERMRALLAAPPADAPPTRRVRLQRRLHRGTKRAARKLRDYRLLRDVAGAIVTVAVLLAVASLVSGGTWPPIVAVESGSMMHSASETPYGRFGTLDVGDIAFIAAVRDPSDVELWVDGGPSRYGRPGSVIAFAPYGDREHIVVLHRAITWIEVSRQPDGRHYTMKWLDGEVRDWGPEGIYFPPLGFDERNGYTRTDGYRPASSGFITKGDNPFTNPSADQALRITALVDPSWIEGEVRGELPWLGLAKLATQNGRTNPMVPGWQRVGNAFAPVELWTMFFLTLVSVLIVPFTLDTIRLVRAERRRTREREALLAAQQAERDKERAQRKPKKPVEFEALVR